MSRRSGNISGASQAPKVPGDDVGSSAPMPELRLQEATTALQQPSSVDPFLIIVLTNDPHLTEEQLRLVRAEVRRGVHRKKKRLPKVNTTSLPPKPSHSNRSNQVASAQSALSMSEVSELQKHSAQDLQPFSHRMSSSVIDFWDQGWILAWTGPVLWTRISVSGIQTNLFLYPQHIQDGPLYWKLRRQYHTSAKVSST
jgi:hypothetical protein